MKRRRGKGIEGPTGGKRYPTNLRGLHNARHNRLTDEAMHHDHEEYGWKLSFDVRSRLHQQSLPEPRKDYWGYY